MKCFRFLITILGGAFLVAAPLFASSYTIDPSRLPYGGTWATAGVPGGFQQYRPGGANARSNFAHDVTYYGAVGDGSTDCTAAFAAARAACAGSNQVMVVPAGTYKITDQVDLWGGMTWRGAGTGSTIIMLYGGGHFYTDGNWPNPSPTLTVTSGATRGSSVLGLADTSTVVVGRQVTLTGLNPSYVHYNSNFYGSGPSDSGHDSTRLLAITFMVVSKTSVTVTLDHPLPLDMSNLTPMLTVWSQYCTQGVGFEDMTIDCTNSGAVAAFGIDQVDSCWWYNVNFHHLYHRSIYANNATNCTVEHCDADSTGTSGGANQEGLDLYDNCCWWLVQNCALDNAGGPMIITGDWGGGCVGCVIAYNYAIGVVGGPQALTSNHGPHNMFNLWEGNYSQSFNSDGYYGSDSHTTLCRNYISGHFTTSVDEAAVVLDHWASNYNVLGNILGVAGYSLVYQASGDSYQNGVIFRLGYPNAGNRSYTGSGSNPSDPSYIDTNVAASAIIHANYDYVNNAQTFISADHDIPSSYYLSSKPSWFGNLTWPPFDPANPNSHAVTQLPAGYRYTYGVDPSGVATTQPPSNAITTIAMR